MRVAVVGVILAGGRAPAEAAETKSPASFQRDVLPVLTKFGCNVGGCHGKLAGQNGFKLSLRGYAPELDHESITQEVNGRRVDFAFPERSLLVQKASGGVMHEGGTRFRKDSRAWQTLVEWIAARAPAPLAEEPMPVDLEVTPGTSILELGGSLNLKVLAREADGRTADVTWLAQFFSNDEALLRVTLRGK